MRKVSEFNELRELIQKERKIVNEMISSMNYAKNSDIEERKMIADHMMLLKEALKRVNDRVPEEIGKINLIKPLPQEEIVRKPEPLPRPEEMKQPEAEVPKKTEEPKKQELLQKVPLIQTPAPSTKIPEIKKPEVKREIARTSVPRPSFIERIGLERIYGKNELKPTPLERETIKRMKKKKEFEVNKKKERPNEYIKVANQFFSEYSKKMAKENVFPNLKEDLIKANLKYTPHSYIAVALFSTMLAFFIGMFLALFFLFFKISPELPIIFFSEGDFLTRLMRVFWIPLIAPIITFLLIIVYPSLEKSSAESNINQELPFAAINMSAISGSMIDPSKIFNIIITTHEYPYLEKEFKKLINEINIYGYDFVSALRDSALKSPSKKLSELFNGLATTINSGGNLPEFFEKRAQTLLFEYGLEKEKKTKAAETFMDIYISIVIAAPMILMILLMMMKMSGLGVSLSTGTITLIIVMAVTMVNVVFLTFLHLKKS
jgi:Flp pilus assembly protein TadB